MTGIYGDSPFFYLGNLIGEVLQVNDHAITKHTYNVFVKDSGREKIQDEFSLVGYDCVAGIVAALIADNNIRLLGKQVNDSSLSFITPVNTCYRS